MPGTIVAGCDIGSLTTKAVLLNNTRVLGFAVIRSHPDPVSGSAEVMDKVLKSGGLSMKDVACCVSTGYGREMIPFAGKAVSEIACHARGAKWLMPSVRTIIDVGGQDCKTMRLDAKGNIEKFCTNDKCASGTGRFLEVMAKLIGVGLDEMGALSGAARTPIQLAAACTAWSQAEVIFNLNRNVPKPDIAAGVNNAMAARVAILAKAAGVEKDVCMTGGVAKNAGVLKALEEQLDAPIRRLRIDPQIIGALGAALMARDMVQ